MKWSLTNEGYELRLADNRIACLVDNLWHASNFRWRIFLGSSLEPSWSGSELHSDDAKHMCELTIKQLIVALVNTL